ncbi:MAG: DUF2974 domain-containing protein [Coriobacteriia bacterium]|nr:DUF2974 domain-containing protein [Coriobacteriia bacterium]
MKSSLVDYVLVKAAPFSEQPFCEADALALTTLAYCYFERGALGDMGADTRLPMPLALCGVPYPELFGTTFLGAWGGPEFVGAVLQSPRYANLQVSNAVSEYCTDQELQFAAVTFHLPDGTTFVAFRGTDTSVAGWKEDFNLSFMREVPSQRLAREYLEHAAGADGDAAAAGDAAASGPTAGAPGAATGPAPSPATPKRIFVSGHSKGGNLSEYAALTCNDATYELIERVYNLDGPAFAFAPSDRFDDPGYAAKLRKIVPAASVFGLLMERRTDLRVVKATGVSLQQHAPTRWQVSGDDLEDADGLYPDAEAFAEAVNSWTDITDPQHREELVEAMFTVVAATNIEDWVELQQDPISRVWNAAKAVGGLSPEVRDALLNMGRYLAKESWDNLTSRGNDDADAAKAPAGLPAFLAGIKPPSLAGQAPVSPEEDDAR